MKRLLTLLLSVLLSLSALDVLAEQDVLFAAQVDSPVSEAGNSELLTGDEPSGIVPKSVRAPEDVGLKIGKSAFPDSKLRKYVRAELDANGNGYLSDDERKAVTILDLSGKGISNLDGIGQFPNLKYLYLKNNKLSSLSLGKNTKLIELDVSGNRLKKLDLKKNKALTTVNAQNNKLTKLSVSKCTGLTYLNVASNALASLNVKKNKKLVLLYCNDNKLKKLSVSKNTKLRRLWCGGNKLTSLNVGKCTALTELVCGNNKLRKLDVSKNTRLVSLYCQGNKLTSLNLRKNGALSVVVCSGNRIRTLDAAKLNRRLHALATDESVLAQGEKEVSWYSSDSLQLVLPASITLFDGPRIVYGKENLLDNLHIHTKRSSYPKLSDAEYANFRNVRTTGMGRNALYRSSSPIRTAFKRNKQADAAAREAGIRSVINMSENAAKLKKQKGYAKSYYATLNVCAKYCSGSYQSEAFQSRLVEFYRFIAKNDGPYLIHCIHGKDRTGFACAVLECLMGASAQEVIDDYMVTYYNFYGIVPNTEAYDYIAERKIKKQLKQAFKVNDIAAEGVDLRKCAEKYLLEIGMTEAEILALRVRLSINYSMRAYR